MNTTAHTVPQIYAILMSHARHKLLLQAVVPRAIISQLQDDEGVWDVKKALKEQPEMGECGRLLQRMAAGAFPVVAGEGVGASAIATALDPAQTVTAPDGRWCFSSGGG